ncbi:MAG: hypothetical protein UV07_C0015G0009 [Candidatus Azambacteria bacterium GW2011_GWB1_42_17]|uniref:Uncharacterized protein n=2 Tax=Candidatus Azamiibacteriota TaxID=1752741 RepID=A0A0G0ZA61_9BACT|nr:MAG: hypothetical protein UV07_C0015G0009 [Candidatus Azambacteria bacterium GW2011_GWB1_42_17]KKS45587.1 MAG: hypothetical protein UV10_C0019G0007 [Candidatus Azambacteria bacterium GW2011_GWA1_42_19]KKS88455.1 MAG: hypothetical protein UV62_C0007G0018 [Parcubacteria group bacterium GW2011_GWC1_43_11]
MKLKLFLLFFLFFGIMLVGSNEVLAADNCPKGESRAFYSNPLEGTTVDLGCKPTSEVNPNGTLKGTGPGNDLPETSPTQPSQPQTQTTNVGITIPNPLEAESITELIDSIATWLLGIGSTIAVIVVLWAAFLFMTSGGSKDQVTKARQTLWYAVIGLTVLLLAKGVTLLIQNILSGRF